MNSLILILGTVAVTMAGFAMLALRRARQAGAYCVALESLLIDADQRLSTVENQVSRLTRVGKETAGRVDWLSAEQGRLAPNVGRTGFNEAIALMEHGASAEQLIEACGISSAEAHLVETLYGRRDENMPLAGLSNKFVLVDADLEMTEHRPDN